jgi:hypothetical protein
MFARFDAIMEIGGDAPSQRAADIVLDIAAPKLAPAMGRVSDNELAEVSRER